ncbi:MAG: transaldolase, partial [Zoogloea sp.]|nr:transaldolase [Zoogloea sp.]
ALPIYKKLEALGGAALELRGKTAVAIARLAYQRYQERFQGPGFADLLAAGGRPQAMLWASTGTKNAAYSDLMYVEPLIAPDTVNTLPDGTLAAFLDHGRVAAMSSGGLAAARAQLEALAALGLDVDALGDGLQADGLTQFASAFAQMLELTA